jgi:hypothetical protein
MIPQDRPDRLWYLHRWPLVVEHVASRHLTA